MTGTDQPASPQRAVRSLSPEARRRDALTTHKPDGDIEPAGLLGAHERSRKPGPAGTVLGWFRPGSRPFEVVRRTVSGTFQDGFIYAGNLAYLAMLSIFPFFIFAATLFQLVGEVEERAMVIDTVLMAMPPTVRGVIEPVANDVIDARSGWLVWFGAAAALWSVSSLIETIRDVLRRAYGTVAERAFWQYRLLSAGLIVGAVLLMLISFLAQVLIGTAQEFIGAFIPQLAETIETLRITRIVPALGLFGSLYLLFFTLTPVQYRGKAFPKWPGALFTALWWLAVTTALPKVLKEFFTYSLTYGSLAGIMVALLFFWLVGLGLVIGAQLNAALAEPGAELKQAEA